MKSSEVTSAIRWPSSRAEPNASPYGVGLGLGSFVLCEVGGMRERLGYPDQQHTHFDLPESPAEHVVSPIAASGAQHADSRYRLRLRQSPQQDQGEEYQLLGLISWQFRTRSRSKNVSRRRNGDKVGPCVKS